MSTPFPFGTRIATLADDDNRLPPLMDWQPPLCGDIDMRIDRRGEWWHEGRHVAHPRVMRQLSRLLRREADGMYYLVTPVEKWRIQVEDQPFIIIDAHRELDEHGGPAWWLMTNAGDRLMLGNQHRLESDSEGRPPVVEIRFGLQARLGNSVFMALIDCGEIRSIDACHELGLESNGVWQPLGNLPPDTADMPIQEFSG
ncbi:DUF1285 domain-containing protein [Kushneria phosphatilytica]|uniref:DUF1285 domain-containing protein n=1 Tax=Kushneria phosphatilytica TaxID=657387 RepID=A0A1S1NW77_9GAMM|nr:DUF1285 domain-containing protein [Kushneria phosphatilytica]OHV11812.1 hypothetical protein BH688_03685 [Kushneria phosphatilytica]QEL10978.1 DUF1285 domain-containing protein [Kushneria phosphatilytica]